MSVTEITMKRSTQPPVTLDQVQSFLVEEAALLDEWRLEEWIRLFEVGARSLIPPLDKPDADPDDALFLVSDDWPRLQSRVNQLLGRTAWAENPRSRTSRLVTNFRILGQTGDEVRVTANFAVWRTQNEVTNTYVGRYLHTLVRTAEGLLFRERKAVLSLDTLRPHGRISFIL